MLKVSLYAVPVPAQCVKGEKKFLGTTRVFMHKAPYTALIAGLPDRLKERGVNAYIEIVDMQTRNIDYIKYGEFDYGGLILEKYRIGCPFEDVIDLLKNDDVVVISANFTHSRRIATDFAKYAKKSNPKAVIVIGGTDATQDPEYYLRNGADIIVRGEGEYTFENLLFNIDRKLKLENISNISYWLDGSIVHNHKTFLIRPFDIETMLPPDLSAVDLSTYTDTGEGKPPWNLQGPFISVETSRGCAQACTFCATPLTKGRYRFMKIDTIHKHFEYFKRMGVQTLLFQEDNILSRVHRQGNGDYVYPEGRHQLLAMFRLAREMEFTWEFTNGLEFGQYIHGGIIDYELIEAMFWHEKRGDKHFGCYRATIPLENLSDENSRLFRKLKPLGDAKNVIRALAQTGVHSLTFNLIIGRPQDDEATLRLSYERCQEVKELVKDTSDTQIYFNIYNLSIFPGTIDYQRLKHMLAFDIEQDPEVITFYLACLRTDFFEPLEMTEARGTLASKLNNERQIQDYDETFFLTHSRWERLFNLPDMLQHSQQA